MTYQLTSVGKMADFETLTISLAKFKSNTCLFLYSLSYRVLFSPGKKFGSQPSSVFKWSLLPTHCSVSLTSHEIRVYQNFFSNASMYKGLKCGFVFAVWFSLKDSCIKESFTISETINPLL